MDGLCFSLLNIWRMNIWVVWVELSSFSFKLWIFHRLAITFSEREYAVTWAQQKGNQKLYYNFFCIFKENLAYFFLKKPPNSLKNVAWEKELGIHPCGFECEFFEKKKKDFCCYYQPLFCFYNIIKMPSIYC